MDESSIEEVRPRLKMESEGMKLEEEKTRGAELKLKEDHLEKSGVWPIWINTDTCSLQAIPVLCGSVEHPCRWSSDPGMEEIVESKRKAEEALASFATGKLFQFVQGQSFGKRKGNARSPRSREEERRGSGFCFASFAIPLPEAGGESDLEKV